MNCQLGFILGDSSVSKLGVEEKLIMLSKNYLKSLKQRVAPNHFSSSWKKRGLTGIVVGTTSLSCIYKLLIAYINDIPHDISLIYKMFFDDTSLLSKILA